MKNPTALLALNEDIHRAELTLQDRQVRLAHRASQALALLREQRLQVRHRVRGLGGLLKPAALMTAGSGVALFLLGRRRSSAAAASSGPSASMAAFVAPLVTRMLAPSLGRDVATLVSTIVLPFAFSGRAAPRTAPLVRWSRYAGHWFELAHLGGGAGPTTRDASITYLPEGSSRRRLRVVARHVSTGGRVTQREGVGRVQAGRGEARLKVTFARGLARLLPGAWAHYWVLDVAPDYSAALMGTPDRKHLWLLGRSPDLDGQVLERMITRAAAQGYDVARLVPVDHVAPGQRALWRSR